MVVLGTNVGIREATGEVVADQNLPGLHIAFGATFSEQTGASWDSPSQMLCGRRAGATWTSTAAAGPQGRYLVL